MAKDYTFVLEREHAEAHKALILIDQAIAASEVRLSDEDLNAMVGGINRSFKSHIIRKLEDEVLAENGTTREVLEGSRSEVSKFIRQQALIKSHRYDCFMDVVGLKPIDHNGIVMVDGCHDSSKAFKAESWLIGGFPKRAAKMTDFFHSDENGVVSLRADWEANLLAVFTSIIPPEYRKAWDLLSGLSGKLGELSEYLQPNNSLVGITNASKSKQSFLKLMFKRQHKQ